jgi:type I restriction enzyme, S subunit
VLGAIDKKIENNRRLLAHTREFMREWFSAKLAQPRDSSLASLSDIARFVNGRAFTKDANGRGRPIIRIRELNSGVDAGTPMSDLEAPEVNVAGHFDLLFSWSGSLEVYRWNGPEALINQHIFKVLAKDGLPAWFVEMWIWHHLEAFRSIAADKATTMGHIQRRHLDEAKVAVPTPGDLSGARAVFDPLDALRARASAETAHLVQSRDALLPKLVSGEIRVPESYVP